MCHWFLVRRANDFARLSLLLDNGANLNALDEWGRIALHQASSEGLGQITVMTLFLEHERTWIPTDWQCKGSTRYRLGNGLGPSSEYEPLVPDSPRRVCDRVVRPEATLNEKLVYLVDKE
jgi:hypothetical protein